MGTVEVIALVLLFALVILAYVALRRWLLQRRGAIDLSVRTRPGSGGRGWVLGIARYIGDDLIWYRVFSVVPGPARTLSRAALEVVSRRTPDGAEAWSVQSGARILECLHNGEPIQLAMGDETLTGFLSWLESAPPGYTMPGYLTG